MAWSSPGGVVAGGVVAVGGGVVGEPAPPAGRVVPAAGWLVVVAGKVDVVKAVVVEDDAGAPMSFASDPQPAVTAIASARIIVSGASSRRRLRPPITVVIAHPRPLDLSVRQSSESGSNHLGCATRPPTQTWARR